MLSEYKYHLLVVFISVAIYLVVKNQPCGEMPVQDPYEQVLRHPEMQEEQNPCPQRLQNPCEQQQQLQLPCGPTKWNDPFGGSKYQDGNWHDPCDSNRLKDPCIESERLCFFADWFDPQATIIKRYLLLYYSTDHSLEMYDTKTNKKSLRRTTFENVRHSDLFLGSMLTILSKKYTLADYADDYTKCALATTAQRTFAMIKPDAIQHFGSIIQDIYCRGFRIVRARMVRLTQEKAKEFYKEHEGKHFYYDLTLFMSRGMVLAMEVVGENAVLHWREAIGPTDSNKAREESGNSIRAKFGKDNTENAIHGSDSVESAMRELDFFFPRTKAEKNRICLPALAKFNNCTCCIIKPHAVKSGFAGNIIQDILSSGFNITGLEIFYLNNQDAGEFYEVYKGVVAEFSDMVNELTNGPSFVLEITSNCPDTQAKFREFVGPADPDIARRLRPGTLRAQYGKDKTRNAVHCTDLTEDSLLEVEFFFKLMQ